MWVRPCVGEKDKLPPEPHWTSGFGILRAECKQVYSCVRQLKYLVHLVFSKHIEFVRYIFLRLRKCSEAGVHLVRVQSALMQVYKWNKVFCISKTKTSFPLCKLSNF